jgi:methyl-accepting chemotaxis protein
MTKRIPYTKIRLIDSLKIRINALIVGIVVIVMGGYAGFDYFSSRARMESELQSSADITSQRLSKHLREPFWALDDEIINEALAAEMLDNHLFAIQVIDRNGQTVYKGYQRDKEWKTIPSLSSISGDFTEKRVDIIRGKEKIGAVKVYVTDKFLKADFQRSMIMLTVTVVFLVFTIAFFVSTVFQRMVIRPVTDMAGLADRISHGELDVTIPVGSNNEIGLLARSFGRMQTSLQISMRTLRRDH